MKNTSKITDLQGLNINIDNEIKNYSETIIIDSYHEGNLKSRGGRRLESEGCLILESETDNEELNDTSHYNKGDSSHRKENKEIDSYREGSLKSRGGLRLETGCVRLESEIDNEEVNDTSHYI